MSEGILTKTKHVFSGCIAGGILLATGFYFWDKYLWVQGAMAWGHILISIIICVLLSVYFWKRLRYFSLGLLMAISTGLGFALIS